MRGSGGILNFFEGEATGSTYKTLGLSLQISLCLCRDMVVRTHTFAAQLILMMEVTGKYNYWDKRGNKRASDTSERKQTSIW